MSGFVKRRRAFNIKGTQQSLHNGFLLTSSGNPSVDHIFGGGFPIGSVIGIGEDQYGNYSNVLTKYFLAEGIVNNHALFLATKEEDPIELIKKLPSVSEEQTTLSQAPENMRIAFRYNQLIPVESEYKSAASLGHYFDLSKTIDSSSLAGKDISYWNDDDVSEKENNFNFFNNAHFASILSRVQHKISDVEFNSTADGEKNLLRICLCSIGSPVWYDSDFVEDFLRFLGILKAIVRNTLSICFITVPFHLLHHLEDIYLDKKIINLFDFSFSLEAFAGQVEDVANPAFKEFHGLMNVKKITPFNGLAPFNPETRDLAFKLKRSKFVIEKLHLPPDIADDNTSFQNQVPSMSCSGGGIKSKLDF
ncbi:elongator complex protein 4 [Anopheles nili]|uniref:elongator complex protein 4 n=1 Tax=Anopheles nili TaxID=185578 RepID=UPI00237BC639|nr:elongator complex protein 4 [Anopheles nili]